MTSAAPDKVDLPNNIDALKALVLDKSAEVVEKEAEAAHYKAKLESLEEQIRLMRHKQFGASSEKNLNPLQRIDRSLVVLFLGAVWDYKLGWRS